MDNHAIVGADASGVIRLWNQAAETLFGHKPGDAIGKTLDLIVPETYRDQHWHGFRAAMASGSAKLDGQSTDIPVQCHDGRVAVFKGAFSLVRDAQKKVIGAMVVFTPG